MRVGTKDGGDGVRCWNRPAIAAYVDEVNRRESQIAQQNPDVVVLPGRLVCYGCEVMEFDYGIKCTAQLTRTRYAVQGETEPRAEDAAGSLLEIPGLLGRAPSDVQPEPAAASHATATGASAAPARPEPASPAPEPRRNGLRGLFGR